MPKAKKNPKNPTGRPVKRAADNSGRAKFGKRLVKERGEQSVAEIAAAAEVNAATIYNLESGRGASRPRPATVARIDAALDLGGELVKLFFRCLPTWEGRNDE